MVFEKTRWCERKGAMNGATPRSRDRSRCSKVGSYGKAMKWQGAIDHLFTSRCHR